MNLDYLRYFVKLAEVRHYTKAAELLSISQPSLSHAIRQLEGELGVPLFEKTGRNTALTRFGEEFLACCRRTLSALDEGVASIKRSAKGEGLIRLGFLRVLGSSYIPELASEFMKANPHRNIQFNRIHLITLKTIEETGNGLTCETAHTIHSLNALKCLLFFKEIRYFFSPFI